MRFNRAARRKLLKGRKSVRHVIVSVYDGAMGTFGRPVFTPSRGAALRALGDEVNRREEQNTMHKHPNDFKFYELGIFDDQTGRFDLYDKPELIGNAVDFVMKDN